jgi:catechol 2,3-dioxygenase-like lactoylglutathione lyase family enzyme
MIGYAMIGTNDLEKAKSFYDAVLGVMGAKRGWANDRMQAYAASDNAPSLVVCRPYDGKPATSGNGTMIAVAAPSRELVDKVHAKALASGGRDEGAPGLRGETFYGAYFRDPDGNKLCVFKAG